MSNVVNLGEVQSIINRLADKLADNPALEQRTLNAKRAAMSLSQKEAMR